MALSGACPVDVPPHLAGPRDVVPQFPAPLVRVLESLWSFREGARVVLFEFLRGGRAGANRTVFVFLLRFT